MQALRDRLDAGQELPADAVADHIQRRVAERWQPLAEERAVELQQFFEEHGDPAYARYSQLLLEPIRDDLREVEAAGYRIEPAFPGRLPDSYEPRTPPEERVRSFWTVVSDSEGTPQGALVYRLFHDHTRFRIPRAPEVFALRETDPGEIRAAVSRL
jgi:hypothetical protein